MSNPWEFACDGDTKVLLGFLGALLLLGAVSWHGCSEATRESIHRRDRDAENEKARAEVQTACLSTGHTALECKELH